MLFTHVLFTLPDIHLQQKVRIKACVSNNTNGFRSICSEGTLTRLCVISIKVQETGQMKTELW